jgi:RND family efflux transporter MFP subunit
MVNVRAPISGVITNIMVNPSEKTHPGQDLFTIASTGGYKAIIMVPDTEISKVRKGSKVTAKWMDKTITGKISSISMAMDQAAKAFRVEASFPGLKKDISFGITAEIDIEVMAKPKVVVVERQHMVLENGDYFVWVNQGDVAIKRPIQVGLDNSLEYEVVEGLNPGDVLITEGINMLTENAKLRVIE